MPLENRTEYLAFRLTPTERRLVEKIAKQRQEKLAEYVRTVVLADAKAADGRQGRQK